MSRTSWRGAGTVALALLVPTLTAGGCGADDSGSAADGSSSAPAGTPAGESPSQTPPADPSPALLSAQQDVETLAPQLESIYRGGDYPTTLSEVEGTLAEAQVTLSPGNSVAGYVYDAEAVEFTLCVENESGAWATYDTAPMTLREGAEDGGCPA